MRLTVDPEVEDKIQEIVETNFDLYKRITDDPTPAGPSRSTCSTTTSATGALRSCRSSRSRNRPSSSRACAGASWGTVRTTGTCPTTAVKTIAALLDIESGDLLLGVADDGIVSGIDHDRLESDDRFAPSRPGCPQRPRGPGREVLRPEDAGRGVDGLLCVCHVILWASGGSRHAIPWRADIRVALAHVGGPRARASRRPIVPNAPNSGRNPLRRVPTGRVWRTHQLLHCLHHAPLDLGDCILHPDNDFDPTALRTFLARRMRWAQLSVTLDEIAADNAELVRDLSRYDHTVTVPFLAGLLTLPVYQSHCVRFEILLALALVHCRGRKVPSVRHAQRWFEKLGHSTCALAEDPAEDVFVSLVHDTRGDYRLLEGAWESSAFYTQRILDVLAKLPTNDRIRQIQRTVRALLILSDLVCARADLSRYELGSDALPGAMSFRNLPSRDALISRVTIPADELRQQGVTDADLAPLLLTPQMAAELPAQRFGCTELDHHPLVAGENSTIVVALPSALSIALRNHAISTMADADLLDSFDAMLATDYVSLLADTPLFGGPLDVPIHWQSVGKHRVAAARFAADKGHYITVHLFLPSMNTHGDGGFKTNYQIDDVLADALQRSVDVAHSHALAQPDFRRGLAVLVGCGWGKGYIADIPQLDDDRWRLQSMSVADLVLLSHVDGMSPRYFWRIVKGFDTITKAGVHIQNINGVLNLIAWVRSNRGHFVPHEQLPDGRISPQQPLLLNPPLNLLRELRAKVVQGFDGHCLRDNTDRSHYVQRESLSPFFDSPSRRRLYVLKDDVRIGRLTSVYEGAARLWVSVATPNIRSRELTFRLWQMVCEWLHRIGDALDRLGGDWGGARTVKVYVVFRDGDPPLKPGRKPAADSLARRCSVEKHREPCAQCAIFEEGFLAGFGIAENVAERLVVRTVARAIVGAMAVEDVDKRVDAITREVVRNQDARQFHLIHAQTFTDFVKDALPEEIVTIDEIDEAAARIGLGIGALDTGQSSAIVGRDECTGFMNGLVDSVLDRITDELRGFDRLCTLRRLVDNCIRAAAERDHWMRTSAAVLALHGATAETQNRFVEQMSAFGGAITTCRVLAEIALCVCPLDGGIECCDIDVSRLVARMALVHRIGGLSDAIYYNALAAKIRVSSLGDILVTDDFGRFVVEPTLSHMVRDRVESEAPLQKKNYDAPAMHGDLRERVGEEFWKIWTAEMGFDLDDGNAIVGALEERGIAEGAAVLEMARSECFRVARAGGVEESAIDAFLDQFCLRTREDWRIPPESFRKRDLYPWKFGRRLSLVARPILQVDDGDDPLLLVAPAMLRAGFGYVVGGAHGGRLDRSFFQTKEMKDGWLGKAREGHSFNAAVARELTEAGWQVRENIRLGEILGRAISRDEGDIDVLAWRADRSEVLVVECKDLAPARSYSEVAALLTDYQGVVVGGKRDKLRRHLDRVDLVGKNVDRLGIFTGIDRPEVVSCLVCSGVVPMQYARIEALAETRVGTVEDVLAGM